MALTRWDYPGTRSTTRSTTELLERGVARQHKGADHTLAALKSIQAARPGGYRLFVICEYVPRNISGHHDLRAAAQEFEGVHVPGDPVQQFLGGNASAYR